MIDVIRPHLRIAMRPNNNNNNNNTYGEKMHNNNQNYVTWKYHLMAALPNVDVACETW